MNKNFLSVSLIIAFVLSSAFVLIIDGAFFDKNSDYVQASVMDSVLEDNLLELTDFELEDIASDIDLDLKEPIGNMCDPFCIVEKEESTAIIFEDLDFSHKNAYAIKKFYDEGFIKGFSDGTFKPSNNLNRAELLAIVLDASDADFSGQVLEDCFKDVKKEWYSAYVCYAKNHGIVQGFSDGTFRPANNVTRAEALKIALETFGFDKDLIGDFEITHLDFSLNDWFASYVEMAKESNVVSKMGRFGGNNPINRADFVQLMYNVMYSRGLL
jgi:hypothetical protein